MNNDNWFEDGIDKVWYPYTQMQSLPELIRVSSTKGCKIYLENGESLIDGVSSWWSACHGYNHPIIVDAMQKQITQMSHVMFAGVAHQPAYDLSARLCKLTGLDKVFFSDSGSTAIETAMKMAVQFWKNQGHKNRNKFVSFQNSYHGDTMGCMSLCDPNGGMHQTMQGYMPRQYSLSLPIDEYSFAEFEDIISSIKNNVAGLIIEPLVQGAGGMKFHSADVLAEIYRITKKHDIIFIADEVMTGFGRTGNMFACNEASIKPDIMCVGKALTAGVMTMAACITNNFIYNGFLSDKLENALMSGPTFMANPLACSVANASLDIFETEDVLSKVDKIEERLYQQLKKCKKLSKVKDVRVKGAIGVVQIDTTWEQIFKMRQDSIKEGVWLRPFGDVVYIMPPFSISDDELDKLTSVVYKLCENNKLHVL